MLRVLCPCQVRIQVDPLSKDAAGDAGDVGAHRSGHEAQQGRHVTAGLRRLADALSVKMAPVPR